MSPGWSLEYLGNGLNGHVWGVSIREEFATCEARMCLLRHTEGSVYLTLSAMGSDEMFILDLGQFWQMASYKRWGTSFITYRSGATGLFLGFPNALAVEEYEEHCNRLLSQYSPRGPALTLEDFQDLAIVPLPRMVGGFLSGAPNYPRVPDLSESVVSSSDEEVDTSSSVHSADPLDDEDLQVLGDGLHTLEMLTKV